MRTDGHPLSIRLGGALHFLDTAYGEMFNAVDDVSKACAEMTATKDVRRAQALW